MKATVEMTIVSVGSKILVRPDQLESEVEELIIVRHVYRNFSARERAEFEQWRHTGSREVVLSKEDRIKKCIRFKENEGVDNIDDHMQALKEAKIPPEPMIITSVTYRSLRGSRSSRETLIESL